MTRTANKVGIWNKALLNIGETLFIEDPDDNRLLSTRICQRVWEDVVEQALGNSFVWPFALTQQALTSPAGVTRTGYDYIYTLPTDPACITPLWLLAEDERISLQDPAARRAWAIMADDNHENSLLCCDFDIDEDDFEVLEYVGYHEYIPAWPREFVEAVAWGVAKHLALGLSKEPETAIRLCEAQYESRLGLARSEALNQGVRDPELNTPSLAVR